MLVLKTYHGSVLFHFFAAVAAVVVAVVVVAVVVGVVAAVDEAVTTVAIDTINVIVFVVC